MNENTDFNLLTPEQAAEMVFNALSGDADEPDGLAYLLTRLYSFIEQGRETARTLDAIDFMLSACYDRSPARHRASEAYIEAIANGRKTSEEKSQQSDTLRVKNLVVESLTLVKEKGETRGELLTREGGKRAAFILMDGKMRTVQMIADEHGECGFTVLDSLNDRYPVRLGFGNPHFGKDAYLEIGDSTKPDEGYLRLLMKEDGSAPLVQVENSEGNRRLSGCMLTKKAASC